MDDLAKLAVKVGGAPEDLKRVRALPVVLVADTKAGVQAVVRDGDRLLIVSVRRNLAGRCQCDRGSRDGFCDHIAAAALTWLGLGNA